MFYMTYLARGSCRDIKHTICFIIHHMKCKFIWHPFCINNHTADWSSILTWDWSCRWWWRAGWPGWGSRHWRRCRRGTASVTSAAAGSPPSGTASPCPAQACQAPPCYNASRSCPLMYIVAEPGKYKMCLWNTMPWAVKKSEKAIFTIKVIVKVKVALTSFLWYFICRVVLKKLTSSTFVSYCFTILSYISIKFSAHVLS